MTFPFTERKFQVEFVSRDTDCLIGNRIGWFKETARISAESYLTARAVTERDERSGDRPDGGCEG